MGDKNEGKHRGGKGREDTCGHVRLVQAVEGKLCS